MAGVSKGTLYVYFDNKERLFAAVVEEAVPAMPARSHSSWLPRVTAQGAAASSAPAGKKKSASQAFSHT